MKLNKDKSFAAHLGPVKNGVRYEQDGHGFDNAGNLVGEIKDGKLVKPEIKETTPELKSSKPFTKKTKAK